MNFRKLGVLVCIILLGAGCGIQSLPSKDIWFAKHYYIMQEFERTAYKNLSSAAKLEFQEFFWKVRAPASKQEFDRRMNTIAENYKKENPRQPWNTDRARVYLLNGSPADIELKDNDYWTYGKAQDMGSWKVPTHVSKAVGTQDRSGEDVGTNYTLFWIYPFGKDYVTYVFTFSRSNSWVIHAATFSQNRPLGRLELRNKLEIYGIVDEKQYKEKLEALKVVK